MAWENKFAKDFKDPDRQYAIYQNVHTGISKKESVAHYDDCGFAGLVGQVKYSDTFPQEEKDWQEAEDGFRDTIRRGMRTLIYDENGYPSGSAGGYVTEQHPEFIAKGLYCYDYWKPIAGPGRYRADVPDSILYKALLLPIEGGDPVDVTDSLNDKNVLHIEIPEGKYYLFMMSIRRLFDGTHATESWSEPRNYISLSDKAATKAFIECTHEKYKEYIGDEFGKGVRATFTDEPSLISWNIRKAVFPILPWLDSYPEDFKKKYGYDFYKACVAVVMRMGDHAARRRCDFWEFIADTVADGFFGTIQDWCHENGLQSSGHMLEEEVLQAHVYCYGSYYRCAEKFDIPGIDELESSPEGLMREGVPAARLAASVADVNGIPDVFTENSGINQSARGEVTKGSYYNYSFGWHLAMGVNLFCTYFQWKQFSDEELRAFNRYVARSNWLLRQGVRDSRVAVLYPEAAMWECYHPSTEERGVDLSPEMKTLENAFCKSSWALLHRQIDFDYIDSRILQKGEIRDGQFCYKARRYSALLLPCARVLEDAAAKRLSELAAAGITVIFADELPTLSRETGEPSRYAGEIAEAVKAGKMVKVATADLGGWLDSSLPAVCAPVVTDGERDMLLGHTRITEDGERIVYLMNMGDHPYDGTVTVRGAFEDVLAGDPYTGDFAPADAALTADAARIHAVIDPSKGCFYVLKGLKKA